MKSLTFLLDLDDTLLGNPMDRFLPPYFAALHQALAPYAPGKNIPQIVTNSIHAAIAHQNGIISNMDAFMHRFCRELDCQAETLRPVLDEFYEKEYPKLRQYTEYRPEARQIANLLFDAGHQVVIATNPLFPAVAICQRLQWAGLADLPFSLITTMENSHFAKPNPQYYQEILTKVQAVPAQSWMVGDDPDNDIVPAKKLGLQTWWITDLRPKTSALRRQGSLADLLTTLKKEIIPA
jgi:HAD superfamily hydrolase (TIGR01549 family)